MNPRLLAYLALLEAQNGGLIEDFFKKEEIDERERRLAKEIAFGTERRLLSLEFILKKIHPEKIGKREKILFFTALYQYYFMNSLPLYAIVNETVFIAKKKFGVRVGNFFNVLLRKMDKKIELPSNNLSIFFSYTQEFIDELIEEYGFEKCKEILEIENRFFPPTARKRDDNSMVQIDPEEVKNNPNFYIQNYTPLYLMKNLSLNKKFNSILDLCAAPGGKLLLAKDFFPNAKLFANDISLKKIEKLQENLKKYSMEVKTFINLEGCDQKFDLIIVDAPCSNSGVFHKRAEARWRMTNLETLQLYLIEKATQLLNPCGEIWYMTCSILKKENEEIVKKSNLHCSQTFKMLPTFDGFDGGFAASITKNTN